MSGDFVAEIEGLDKLLRTLRKLPDGVAPRGGGPLNRAMRAGAGVWRNAARQKVAGLGPGIKNERTGSTRLKDSILLQRDPDPESNNVTHRYVVGYRAKAFWGAFVERGTEKQSAQPFLRPSFDENEQAIMAKIGQVLRRDIEKAVEDAKR